ncbi:DUF7127 family protein [Halorarius litoreus]|uniref:DUF7127 family protein n=1 Tax=Halorarius litoreus TaxID=2962676 RepID=UPI0020CF6A9B|nr:hypothetical protein [Halorarius litoreus]
MTAFQERFARREDAIARQYEYEDRVVLVADLGPGRNGSIDLLDGTAIVVVGDDEYEFDLPEGEARASMSNGVVTVEVKR